MDRVVRMGTNVFRWLIGDGAPLGRRTRAALAGVAALLLGVGAVATGVLQGSGGSTAYGTGGHSPAAGGSAGRETDQAPFTSPPPAAPGHTVPSAGAPGGPTSGSRPGGLHALSLTPVLGIIRPPSSGTAHGSMPVSGTGALGARSANGPSSPSTAPGTSTDSATTAAAPATATPPPTAAPTGVSVDQGTGWLQVSWEAPPHPDSVLQAYNVYVATTPGGEGPIPVNGASLVFGTTYTVSHLPVDATYYVTVQAFGGGGFSPASAEATAAPDPGPPTSSVLAGPVVAATATPDGSGYWLVDGRGDVSAHGGASFYGPATALSIEAPVVGMAATPDGRGYWEVTADGQVYAFGDAGSFGSVSNPSTGGLTSSDPIVAMAPTRDGRGYWLVAVDGAVFPFGDAPFLGSTGAQASSAPIVGMALDPATGGYWLVDNRGGVFGFNAPDVGSMAGQPLDAPVIGMAATGDGQGYWLVADDGGVFAFGDAVFAGSGPDFGSGPEGAPGSPMVGMAADLATGGYWLVESDGSVFACSAPFFGSA